jgi:hypothetical protein
MIVGLTQQLRRGAPWLFGGGLFVVAVVLAATYARPFAAASIAWDAAASVLHFQRIAAGQHLEAFVPTTPKPLLTVVFGAIYSLTTDWRAVAWATIFAFAAGVTLMAEVARRILGWAAWALVAAGLAGSVALLYDVGYALATPWAFLFVAAAGFALTTTRRTALAGVLLGLGALARPEVLIAIFVAGAILVGRTFWPGRRADGRPPVRDWLVLLGLLAVPVMCLHDWLLTGDPLFWTTVAVRYSETTRHPIADVGESIGFLVNRYGMTLWPLTLLAIVGVVELLRTERGLLLAGVLAFGLGVAGLLVVLAARHVYVPTRYFAPIDLAFIVAAGAAASWAERTIQARGPIGVRQPDGVDDRGGRPDRSKRWTAPTSVARALAPVVAALAGVLIAWPTGWLDTKVEAAIARSKQITVDGERARPALVQFLARHDSAPPTGSRTFPLVLVPNDLVPRFTVELRRPFTDFGRFDPANVDPAIPRPAIGQVALHDRNADGRVRPLEISSPTPFGPARAVPLASDARRGYWLVEIRAP